MLGSAQSNESRRPKWKNAAAQTSAELALHKMQVLGGCKSSICSANGQVSQTGRTSVMDRAMRRNGRFWREWARATSRKERQVARERTLRVDLRVVKVEDEARS